MKLRVTVNPKHPNGKFARCGHKFTTEPTLLESSTLDPSTVTRLKNEPWLKVVELTGKKAEAFAELDETPKKRTTRKKTPTIQNVVTER